MPGSEMNFHRIINDPIWGNIGITKLENDIINTDAFNRLRQIKQMSMAYIGHIGAQHTRYEHSLGCMHTAYNLASNLDFISEQVKAKCGETYTYLELPNSTDFQIIRIAALLHDIGHAPLSHLLESAIEKYPVLLKSYKSTELYTNGNKYDKLAIDEYSHEMFSVRALFNNSEIGGLLDSVNIKQDIIAYLISGHDEFNKTPPKYKVYKNLISGDLDADRLDYINRDFYFCGIKQTIDMTSFADALLIGLDNKDRPNIIIKEESILQASSFLFSRFMLAQSIHNNKETRINEQAFIDLIRGYLFSFGCEARISKIFDLHTNYIDSDLLNELSLFDKEKNSGEIAAQYEVKRRLNYSPRDLTYGKARKNYTTVYSLTWQYLHPFWRYYLAYIISHKELISKIEKKIGYLLSSDDFILDIITSKPSKMDLLISRDEGVSSLINECNITIPHALMATAFQSDSLNIYAKEKCIIMQPLVINEIDIDNYISRQVLSDKDLDDDQRFNLSILKIIEDIVVEHLDQGKKMPKELLLLFIMRCLKEYVRNNLGHKSTMWLKGETSFQSFLFTHFKDEFFANIKDDIFHYNPDIYRISERLVCWGLIDHIHKPIHLPTATKTNNTSKYKRVKYSARIDRNINQWGDSLVDYLNFKISSMSDLFKVINEKVIAIQDSVKPLLHELMEKQLTQKMDKGSSNDTYSIEKEIKDKNGCLIKFI